MTNTGNQTLTFTGNDNRPHTYSFGPGDVLIEKINDRQALVMSFSINGTHYFHSPGNGKSSQNAVKIQSIAQAVLGGGGLRYGIKGGIAGVLAGFAIGQIIKHLPDNAQQEGYYHEKALIFKGKKIIDL